MGQPSFLIGWNPPKKKGLVPRNLGRIRIGLTPILKGLIRTFPTNGKTRGKGSAFLELN